MSEYPLTFRDDQERNHGFGSGHAYYSTRYTRENLFSLGLDEW